MMVRDPRRRLLSAYNYFMHANGRSRCYADCLLFWLPAMLTA